MIQSITVDVDPGRLRQILYNLLSNAIKYTGKGGRVRVTRLGTGREVRIAVQDTGVGIAPADQRACSRSSARSASRRSSGRDRSRAGVDQATGRGARRPDRARVGASGSGATFTVILPDGAPAPGQPPTSDRPAPREPVAAERGDILVIEDEPSSARLLQTYLGRGWPPVASRRTGKRGLAMARAERPAAIVLDVLLPGIDGWEVLRRLKADEALRDMPVIIATVVDERGVGLALGAVDYLVKPVDPEALLDRLGRYTFTTSVEKRAHVRAGNRRRCRLRST